MLHYNNFSFVCIIINSELYSVDDNTNHGCYISRNDEHSTEDNKEAVTKEQNADEIQDYIDMTEASARRYINAELPR